MAIVENNLKDDAHNWFIGAKGVLFNNYIEFSKEIEERFTDEADNNEEAESICEIADGFIPGKISELLFKAHAARGKLSLDYKILIRTDVRHLPSNLVREMIECSGWKSLLRKERQLNSDFNQKNENLRGKMGNPHTIIKT